MIRISALVQALALAGLLAPALPAFANDSQAEITIGGLELRQSDSIRLDKQDLYISEAEVRVNYVFTNTANRDISTLVAFPLPDFQPSPIQATPDYRNELNFRTLVDGQPLALEIVEKATLKGQDITAFLRQHNIPVMPVQEPFDRAINGLPAAVRNDMIKQEMIVEDGENAGVKVWLALWTISTSITRQQVFPAGKSVQVEHRYKPFAGGSVGGAYNREARQRDYFRERVQKFCIDRDFLATLDRRLPRLKEPHNYSETWLGYALKPGANWLGPIKEFRLVVDKGAAENLVSFCANGVKKIGPTRFEVRYKDYKPTQDLSIMILKFEKPWQP